MNKYQSMLLAVVLGALLVSERALAQIAKTTVTRASIEVKERGNAKSSAGRLYKIGLGSAKGVLVAEVNEAGTPAPSFECERTDKIIAETDHPLAVALQAVRACASTMEFKFGMIQFGSRYGLGNAAQLVKTGDFASAQAVFAEASFAAIKNKDAALARLASEQAVANAARALGDTNLDQLVVRDPSQGYQLVFSKEGESALMKIQSDAKLKATGALNYPTQLLIKNSPMKAGVESK